MSYILLLFKDRCSAVNTFTQEAKLNLVTADLNGLRADLVNKILLSCLDESLKDKTADRQKLIKVTKLSSTFSCVVSILLFLIQ